MKTPKILLIIALVFFSFFPLAASLRTLDFQQKPHIGHFSDFSADVHPVTVIYLLNTQQGTELFWCTMHIDDIDGGINLYNSVSNNMVNGYSGGMSWSDGMEFNVGNLGAQINLDPWGNKTKEQWQIIARKNAGMDKRLLKDFQPGLLWIHKSNQTMLNKIYANWLRLYQKRRTKFLWSAAASVARNTIIPKIIAAQKRVDTLRRNGATFINRMEGLAHSNQIVILMTGAKNIFEDIAWQHEAYDAEGISEIRSLWKAKKLGDKFYNDYLYIAWCLINKKDKASIKKGNNMLLTHEQFNIVQAIFDRIPPQASWSRTILDTLSKDAVDPFGKQDFKVIFPNGDITNAVERLKWAEEYVVGPFINKTVAEREELLKKIWSITFE